jgi:hypothetical protein
LEIFWSQTASLPLSFWPKRIPVTVIDVHINRLLLFIEKEVLMDVFGNHRYCSFWSSLEGTQFSCLNLLLRKLKIRKTNGPAYVCIRKLMKIYNFGLKCRPQKWPCGEEWSGQEILYCRVGEWESQEREGGGQGLKYPSVRLGMIWLVRILWFMLIGCWGRRVIQTRIEAGPWPWETEA